MSNSQQKIPVYIEIDGKQVIKQFDRKDVIDVIKTNSNTGKEYVHFRLVREHPIPKTPDNNFNDEVAPLPLPHQRAGKKHLSKKTSKKTSSKPKTTKPKTTKPKTSKPKTSKPKK